MSLLCKPIFGYKGGVPIVPIAPQRWQCVCVWIHWWQLYSVGGETSHYLAAKFMSLLAPFREGLSENIILRTHCPYVYRISAIYCNMKCSGENMILRGIFNVVSRFPLNFLLNRENLYCFSSSVVCAIVIPGNTVCIQDNIYLTKAAFCKG